jgi:hypothetical protein
MCLPQDRLPDHQEVLVEQPDLAQVATSLAPHQAVHPEEHRLAVHRVIPLVVRPAILQVHLHQAVVRPAILLAVLQAQGLPVVLQARQEDHHQVIAQAVHQVVVAHRVEHQAVLLLQDRQVLPVVAIHQVVPQVTLLADLHQVLLPVVQIVHQAAPILLVADQVPVAAQDVHQHQVVHLPEDHPAVADNKKKPLRLKRLFITVH